MDPVAFTEALWTACKAALALGLIAVIWKP